MVLSSKKTCFRVTFSLVVNIAALLCLIYLGNIPLDRLIQKSDGVIIKTIVVGVFMKQQIIGDICTKLNELKIPFTIKDDTYIYVNTEFYDVGYGTQSKMVLYDLTVFIDEPNTSVFMYVKTAEKYISAEGTIGEYTNQSSSLFRTVKSVCSDSDGKVSVITIDLGQVPNTVKDTAFKYGWKFRTALNLNKRGKKSETAAARPAAESWEPEAATAEPVGLTEPEPAPPPKDTKKRGIGTRFKNIFRR